MVFLFIPIYFTFKQSLFTYHTTDWSKPHLTRHAVCQSLMSRFNVQGFPTILVFGADKDSPIPYEGARTASAIESFALDQLETNVAPPEVTELTGSVSCLLVMLTVIDLWNIWLYTWEYESYCLTPIGRHGWEMCIGCHLFCCFPARHFGFQGRRKEQIPRAIVISCREVQKKSLQASI